MAFREFTFPDVKDRFGLQIEDAVLFPALEPIPLRADFVETIRYGSELASANSTEKAKSEFVIAPILLELRRRVGDSLKLFSGVEWDVDREKGLNGYCDFTLTHGPSQWILEAPFAAIAEAKNDLLASGFGLCIAAMVAAKICNERAKLLTAPIYGIVSTGAEWQFLRLSGTALTLDRTIYSTSDLPKLLAVLHRIVKG